MKNFTRKNRWLVLLMVLYFPNQLFGQPYTDRLGVNINNGGVFADLIKEVNRYQEVNTYDTQGWPQDDFQVVILDPRPFGEWWNTIDDPEKYTIDYSGTYHGSFQGKATISSIGGVGSIQNQQYDAATNRTTFELIVPAYQPNRGIVRLKFADTQRNKNGSTDSGLTQLKLMRPGYTIDTQQTFTDEYINLLKSANFACYRYYTVQNIWEGEPTYPATTEWNQRKLPTDASQLNMAAMNGKRDGWAWEHLVEMANLLQKDIWINVHISCSKDYVRQLAQKLKKELHPDINIYVENSNEVWSPTHGTEGPYNQKQAQANGISFDQNYARRSVELSDLFKEVFGAEAINRRIRVILAGQAAYLGRSVNHLNYINDTFGPPKNFIYATSAATYFNTSAPDGNPDQINEGMFTDVDEKLNDANNGRKKHIALAAQWQLPGGCTSYEGGAHTPAGGVLDNLGNQIKAHRTPKMRQVMEYNLAEGWFEQGGGLALQFSLSSAYSRHGAWGLTDDYTKPDRNHKMQAMRNLAGAWVEAEPKSTVSAPTKLQANASSANTIKVSWQDNAQNETGFRLEVSQDGGSTFSEIAKLAPNVTTYIHENLTVGQPYCYRISAFHLTGSSEFTDTICVATAETVLGMVENTFGNAIDLYPNPTTGSLTITLDKEYSPLQISILDARGQVVQKRTIGHTQRIALEIHQPSGVYIISLTSASSHAIFRVVKR